MANFKLVALLAGVLALILVDYSKIYVSPNFERPSEFKMKATFLKIGSAFASIGSTLKLGSEPALFRSFLNVVSTLIKSITPRDDSIIVEDTKFGEIPVRIYTPRQLQSVEAPRPFIIYFHGGYYIIGSLDNYDQYLFQLAKKTNLVVISVDYNLAPENPFPGPFNDCVKTTEYILENSKNLNLDTSRYVIAGDSAGGHATAGVTQYLAKAKKQQPKLQILIYPWVQTINLGYPSEMHYRDKIFMSNAKYPIGRYLWWLLGVQEDITEEMESFFSSQNHTLLIEDAALKKKFAEYLDVKLIPEHYKIGKAYYKDYASKNFYKSVFPNKVDVSSLLVRETKLVNKVRNLMTVEAQPGLAHDSLLKLLPKAYVIIFEWDTLKDQGLIYSERLRMNGVPVEVAFYEDAFHGMIQFVDEMFGYSLARKALDDLANYINDNMQ